MAKFTGEVKSDFMKFVRIPDGKKQQFVDFASTDFMSLRQSILDYIRTVYPLDYQNFKESDLGVMLIELISYMGSIMSFKADALALSLIHI